MTWKWFATIKKLIKLEGFDVDKNGPSRLENYANTFKKCKMAKNHFSSANSKNGLRILIRAPEVSFLVPLKPPKWGHFNHYGGTKNGTSGAQLNKFFDGCKLFPGHLYV